MMSLVPYDPTIPFLIEGASFLIDFYENNENRNLQIKLNEINYSIQKSINKKDLIETSIISIAQVLSTAIDSFTKLNAFEKTLDIRQKEIESKIKIIDNISIFMEKLINHIVIDTSNLNEEDKKYAFEIRNKYFELQDKYLNIIGKII